MSPLHKPGPFGAADCLSLLAAPTFAAMALVTAAGGGSPLDMLCSASPLVGMAPMYALMSIFHMGPWLRLLPFVRRASPRGCRPPA
jgi:uncharacterized membrane protein YeiH